MSSEAVKLYPVLLAALLALGVFGEIAKEATISSYEKSRPQK